MRRIKPSLALASVAVVALAVLASARQDRSGSLMARAADRWLASLSDEQKATASFAFDDAERRTGTSSPRPRKGLPIKEMAPEQRALAFGLIGSGLAAEGVLEVTHDRRAYRADPQGSRKGHRAGPRSRLYTSRSSASGRRPLGVADRGDITCRST
ncbi:MAG: DUF3500 domain-containing protein [Isosphaeraceae bacterium]